MTAKKSTIQDPFIKVASLGEIPAGGAHLVEVDDTRVALFNIQGTIYAIEDTCTHDGGPLVEGHVVNGHEVECPRHGARFDVRTGAALSFPAFRPTQSLQVRVDGDDVFVEVPA